MRKNIIILFSFVLLFSTLATFPFEVNASKKELNDVQDERNDIQEKLSEKEAEIVNVLDDISALHEEVAETERAIAANETKIAETSEKIDAYEDDFRKLADEITDLNKMIEKRHEILKDRISSYQANGGDISYLEVIFNAKDFNEFVSRVNSVTTITNADNEMIEQQESDRLAVEEKQDEISDKIEKQEQLVDELEETKASIVAQKQSLKNSEKSLKEKEVALKKEKDKLGAEDSKLAGIEKQYRDNMEKEKKASEHKAAKKEASSVATSETPKQESTSKTVKPAAKPKPKSKPKEEPASSGKTFTVEATAYGPDCVGCSGISATGMNLKTKPTPKVIAVDPSVIPLGSRVWVEGYGVAVAADTGGAIKGKIIDVLYPSEKAAYSWGRRTVKIKILD